MVLRDEIDRSVGIMPSADADAVGLSNAGRPPKGDVMPAAVSREYTSANTQAYLGLQTPASHLGTGAGPSVPWTHRCPL